MSGVLRLIAFLLAAISALLAGCGGGGGGGGQDSSPQTPPAPRTSPLQYGYFGIDGDQIRETADHVSFVMAPDWGDWTLPGYDEFRIGQIIAQLQEAKARGIKDAWVCVGFLVFDGRTMPRPDAIPRLTAFRAQLAALGLDDMVRVLYPIDEPDLHHNLTDANLGPLLQAMKVAWPEALLGVIYGDTQNYAGLAWYDLVGKDKYGSGAGVLNQLPPISGGQKHIIVPGGSNGLRDNGGPDDPQAFYEYAMSHNDVAVIMPFVWFDRTDERGNFQKGIRSNGMAPRYIAIAQKIKAAL